MNKQVVLNSRVLGEQQIS